MIFDLFHSISDPVVNGKTIGPKNSISQFLEQAVLAEDLGMDTVWLAESHFSSETQKKTSVATIQNFHGEVGLNVDSFQFFHLISQRTKKINFGTGIHNIVGGSGGPIASSERVSFLSLLNEQFLTPRTLRIGVASGRFPYQNTPFGITARNELERDFWPHIKRVVFIEALEIFLRLLKGEELESSQLTKHYLTEKDCPANLKGKYHFPLEVPPRWSFEKIKLIPLLTQLKYLQIVLGSSDPEALDLAYRHWPVDLFNLSFTPPEQIDKLHAKMTQLNSNTERPWHRSRLPRTVLVFTDPSRQKAKELASNVIDTYIEAMKGTAQVPDKSVLMERALIGDASEIKDQLHPENPRKFHSDDRLMLWFEFNQLDGEKIKSQMRYFFKEVVEKI